MSGLDSLREDWDGMDKKFKIILIATAIGGAGFFWVHHQQNVEAQKGADEAKLKASAEKAMKADELGGKDGNNPNSLRVLPRTNRNQGLEDLMVELDGLRKDVAELRKGQAEAKGSKGAGASGGTSGFSSDELNTPAPVDFGAPPVSPPSGKASKSAKQTANFEQPTDGYSKPQVAVEPEKPAMRVWQADDTDTANKAKIPSKIIPVNSAVDGVMLSGINARPAGSSGGGSVGGAIQSAVSVGTPFVTRLKGDVLLPNGWRLADLGDCFLGGSGIAVLSMERVNAIADKLSCIGKDGRVWEASVKAYALDVDGIQGLAGKVVSKQGTVLMQAALTGMASGLGSALTPTPIVASNTSSTGGTQSYQTPSLDYVAQTAVGAGIEKSTAALSKFYLDFAKEVFPVIEVGAGTRVTWVFKESVEIKVTKKL